jgi:hypothetical protein
MEQLRIAFWPAKAVNVLVLPLFKVLPDTVSGLDMRDLSFVALDERSDLGASTCPVGGHAYERSVIEEKRV